MAKRVTVDLATYTRHLDRAFAGHNYFSLFRDFTLLFPPGQSNKSAAVLLCDLINRKDMLVRRKVRLMKSGQEKKANAVKFDKEGFFGCSMKFLMSKKHPPVWSKKEQERLFPLLVRTGFIKTEVRKTNRGHQRWVWIDQVKINTALDNLNSY